MYSNVKELQRKGFTERQSAKILKINQRPSKVPKYVLDQYMDYVTTIRKVSSLEELKPVILEWLHSFPA